MDEYPPRHKQWQMEKAARWLIARTIQDLRDRAGSDDEYTLLGLAGVLRRTIIDQQAVARRATDRRTLSSLRFRWHPPGPPVMERPEFLPVALILPEPGAFREPTESGSINQFRAAPVANAGGDPVTVSDLIWHFAHVEGGVHIGHPDDEKQRLMQSIFSFRGDAWRRGLDLLADVATVAADGLSPLASIPRTPFEHLDDE